MKPVLDKLHQLAYWILYRLACAWWRLRPSRIHGVFVAVWWNGQVLLIRNSYRRDLTFPGGMVRPPEARTLAAARELFEEAGIAAEPVQLTFCGPAEKEPGRGHGDADIFELHLTQPPVVQVDNREVVWAAFQAPAAALAQPHLAYPVRQYLWQRQPPAGDG